MNGMAETFTLISGIFAKLLAGLPMTLALAIPSVLMGLVLAVGLALMCMSSNRFANLSARAFIYVFRGIPLLVLLFLIYNGLPQFRVFWKDLGIYGVVQNAMVCSLLALTLNSAAYGGEIIRGSLKSVPFGQIEAGRACGMSRWLLLRRIIFPIAIRQALPGYTNEIISMVKATTLVGLVTPVVEVMHIEIAMRAKTLALEGLLCAGVIFLILNNIIIRALAAYEYSLSPHLRPPPDAVAAKTQPVAA